MRILFTQHGLANQGGTELFVLETASALARRGHNVAVYAGSVGRLSDVLVSKGVSVLADPRDCPWEPEVIHGQHRIHALKALSSFPACPSLLHIHGLLPSLERPFVHPRVLKYLVTSPNLSRIWSRCLGVPEEAFAVLPNHVDLDRFSSVRVPAITPKTALLFSNNAFTASQLKIVEEACAKRGMTLEVAGMASGAEEPQPEHLLPQFDLVFAIGRSALEAAASGCAVIPILENMAEELLTTENYGRLRDQNMAVRLRKHAKLSKEWIDLQLAKWDKETVSRVTKIVRSDARLEKTLETLERVYSEIIENASTRPRAPIENELTSVAEVINYNGIGEATLKSHRADRRRVDACDPVTLMQARRITELENSTSWRITAPLRFIGRHARRLFKTKNSGLDHCA